MEDLSLGTQEEGKFALEVEGRGTADYCVEAFGLFRAAETKQKCCPGSEVLNYQPAQRAMERQKGVVRTVAEQRQATSAASPGAVQVGFLEFS